MFALQTDFNDDVDVDARNCKGDFFDPRHPFPNGVEATNLLWERRLDEASAYFNLDQAAEYFLERHGYRLNRSSRANPQILTAVNHSIGDPAWFSSRTQWDGAHPLIAVDKGWCWQIVLGGNDVMVGSDIADIYSLTDVSRDRDLMMHEFTHAVNWDIISMGWKQYSSPFKEGIADFFPLSSRYDAATGALPVFSPWFNDANLDPVGTGGVELDRATPYFEITATTEEHAVGRIWSEFLWDLRDRAFLLETDFATRNIAQHDIEDLQFEALFRMDTKTSSFSEALQNLLSADAESNGKNLSYEIVASAARHGIKLDRGIAAIEPNRYVIGPDIDPALNLTFTIYSGANDACLLEVATDPALFGGESGPSNQYHSETCGTFEAIIGALDQTTGLPIDRENLTTQVRVDPGRLAALGGSGGGEPVLLFYRVLTGGPGGPAFSDIPGAGVSWRHSDLPAVVFVPAGTDPGCVCAIRPASRSRAPIRGSMLLAIVGLVVALRRRARL